MSEELIQPEGVNSAVLKQLFDAAYMEASIDSDGDVRVKDKFSCFLRPDADGKLITVYAIFGFNPSADRAAKLDYANRVNDEVKVIRASVASDGRYFFDYYISVDGGISQRSIVMAVKRFLACMDAALSKDTGNVVA